MRKYQIRYSVEGAENSPDGKGFERDSATRISDGLSVSHTDYGYSDDLFVASVLRDDAGEIDSVLLLGTDRGTPTGPKISRELLMAVKEQIDHYIEHHLEKS